MFIDWKTPLLQPASTVCASITRPNDMQVSASSSDLIDPEHAETDDATLGSVNRPPM